MLVGIDLGTSNSAVTVWHNGESRLVPNAYGENLTPSVIGIDDNGHLLVGAPAYARRFTHPDLTISSFKRFMGTDHIFRIGTHQFRAEELSAMLLSSLKSDVEQHFNCQVERAVITVPAYFNDIQRKAVRAAGEIAGLKVERLLNEPTAAALAYGLAENSEQKFLVFDLGGGTFDVSIIDMFEGVIEVRASCGDIFLGGDDFTQSIAKWMIEQYPQLSAETTALNGQLTVLAERMKRQLTTDDKATTRFEFSGETLQWELSNQRFNECCEAIVQRLKKPVIKALHDARFSVNDIDQVVLVGGATRMPQVRQAVARLFGRFPLSHLQPDEAIALGAGIQAGLVMQDSALDDVVLTDVMPFSLGINVGKKNAANEIIGGFFQPLIERNSFVPVSISNSFSTLLDNQEVVNIHVYQGESRRVDDNISLGSLAVDVPRRPAGEVSLDVRFTYTLDGILEVACQVVGASEPSILIIEKNPGTLSPEQIADSLLKLATLKQHPRDQLINRDLLAQANELYQQSLGDARQIIDYHLTHFEAELSTQDVRRISTARSEFRQLLEQMKNSWDQ